MKTEEIEKILQLFYQKPTVYELSNGRISKRYNFDYEAVTEAKRQYRENRHKALKEHCDLVGIDPKSVSSYWHKSKYFSLNVKNPKETFEMLREELVESIKNYSPVYPKIKREKCSDPHLLVIDPADIHVGKLSKAFETGEEFNSQIAVQRVMFGVKGLLDKTVGYNIEKILLIIGNDILHVDNPKRTTTSGTPQDTDGMWYDNFLIAKQLYVEVIEMLLQVAPVLVQYNPSNHDYTNGFFLADTIATWFRKCEDVSFNTSISHRKYFHYGVNLIGSTHGDGAKEQDLPLLMAQEAAREWSESKYRYFYTHHIHHKRSRDYGSVTVESLRSPSGTDSWHHRNGYQHSPKAVEGFLHHPVHGQVARFTHYF